MQNPRQPLGPFPAEIVQTIARQNPQVYSRLSQTNRRLRNIVQPALQQICQSPIRGYEIIRALTDFYRDVIFNDNVRLTLSITPDNEVEILSGIHPMYLSLNDAANEIDILLNSDFQPTLDLMLKVYKKRLSCVKVNPKYANELLVEEYLNRYKLLPKDNLFNYFDRLKRLVTDLAQALNISYPDFYYEEPESYIEVQDYIEKFEVEGQRLINLARE